MFTGLISDVGTVLAVDTTGKDVRFRIGSSYDRATIPLGASIACAGCCLTVVETESAGRGCVFAVDVSRETLSRTTLGMWLNGTRINLERSLKLGDELGGHLVSGHVDAVGKLTAVTPVGGSLEMTFEVPDALKAFIAPKGSVALDGTSFTVNSVSGKSFTINVVPHTQAVTTWGSAAPGDSVNVEIDMLARYVARLLEAQNS